MNTFAHPDRSELAALLLGELSAESEASVSSHVDVCPDCQSLVETLDTLEDTFVATLRKSASVEQLEISPACAGVLRLAVDFPLGTADSTGTGIQPPKSELPPVILDYQLGEPIGQGGMGTVYKALQTHLDKIVAIKVLPSDRLQDPSAVARFRREIRAVGKLDHPNLVRALNAGEVQGRYYLAMEFVDGLDLSRLVNRLGTLPIPAACELIRQAALGLQHAHEHGMVHRDIKPGNIMLSQQGMVKVLDLGLALLPQQEVHELTSTGNVMGTLDYMSPEQGGDSHHVDIRADIYSLGATLFKLLTGHAIYHGRQYTTPVQKITAIATEEAPSIQSRRPDVPADLAAIVHRMIAKNPADRFATPAEVAAALTPFSNPVELLPLLKEALARPDRVKPLPEHDDSSVKFSAPAQSTVPPTESLARPLASPAISKSPPSNLNWLLIAAAGGILAVVFGVWVIVRDNRGREIARVHSDAPVTVEKVEDHPPQPSKPAKRGKPNKNPAVQPPLTPPAHPVSSKEVLPPLSRLALVGSPALLAGVESWTVETVGHRAAIRTLAISPDSKWLATAGEDGSIRVWNLADGVLQSILVGHDDIVRKLIWSRDSRQLISIDWRTCFVWDLPSGRRRLLQQRTEGQLNGLGWGETDRHLILASIPVNDAQFEIVDVQTGKLLSKFVAPQAGGFHAGPPAISPNGKRIAVANREAVYVLDATGKVLNSTPAASQLVYLDWSSDSEQLAVGLQFGTILVWNPNGKKLPRQFRHDNGQGWVTGVTWSADNTEVIVHGHSVKGWKVATGESTNVLGQHSAGHHYALSPDGKTAVLAIRGTIEAYDCGTRKLSWIQNDSGTQFAHAVWSPRGEQVAFCLASEGTPASICIARTRNGEILSRRQVTVNDLRWMPDGSQLVVAQEGGELQFFDLTSDQPKRTLLTRHRGTYYVRINGNGQRLATSDDNGSVKLWTLGKTEPDHIIAGHTGPMRVEWSPDGNLLAVAVANEGKFDIYDPTSGKKVAECQSPQPQISKPCWSPDSRTVIGAGSHMGEIYCFDARNGELIRKINTLPGGWGYLWPTEKRLVVFSYGHQTRWWNWEEGRFESPLPQLDFDHYASSLAADGRGVMSLELPSCLASWDCVTGQRHGTLLGMRQQRAIIGPRGDLSLSHPAVQSDLRVVAHTDGGQRLLTVSRFTEEFGWKNDSQRATLYVPVGGAQP